MPGYSVYVCHKVFVYLKLILKTRCPPKQLANDAHAQCAVLGVTS